MTIGQPSGQYLFNPALSEIVVEAFSRCQVRTPAITRAQWIEARRSLNLGLVRFANRGVNLWKVEGPITVDLVAGQATYAVPNNAVSMLDMYFTTVNGGGQGINIDRIMIPIGRTEYAEYPNKLAPGTPSVYWYQKLTPTPQFTIYQVAASGAGAPTYVLNYYYLSQINDAIPASGQTADVPYRFLEALCAETARRLAQKYMPQLYAGLAMEAKETWEEAADADREDAPIHIRPILDGYFRV